ncbi:prepilin-type N-terminal cleavage/methylation domain-containing protein [Halobacillus locisalis]|uniref:Prepilin-type N-terminal cleavage/methylation domain-containing protein n=1 Tax=Halobacillus locisalis TaxID=220753 RepID=A0A838CP27_9BACI|nr:competence type IV pilus minor pilin ComGF [Halobacillus locisalis]MBA2173608.1 prepilin-type N-terminal cleavage/methylation domain-containing protein [Halobacillus locisalis]
MRPYVFLPDHHKGFTMMETLISLFIFLLIVSLSAPLLRLLDSASYNQELAANQLFQYIQMEVTQSQRVTTTPTSILLTDVNDRMISIEKYGNIIRRQVNSTGHEPLLKGVEEVLVDDHINGFIMKVRMKENERYSKFIFVPPHKRTRTGIPFSFNPIPFVHHGNIAYH